MHIQELRDRLNEARAALSLAASIFTDATLIPFGTIIKAAHVNELRSGTKL
jgi:hypothetical protein